MMILCQNRVRLSQQQKEKKREKEDCVCGAVQCAKLSYVRRAI